MLPDQLAYVINSPRFCNLKTKRLSVGVDGRQCFANLKSMTYNCDYVCCGYPHQVVYELVSTKCHCKMIFTGTGYEQVRLQGIWVRGQAGLKCVVYLAYQQFWSNSCKLALRKKASLRFVLGHTTAPAFVRLKEFVSNMINVHAPGQCLRAMFDVSCSLCAEVQHML